jgi:hypothetical protein
LTSSWVDVLDPDRAVGAVAAQDQAPGQGQCGLVVEPARKYGDRGRGERGRGERLVHVGDGVYVDAALEVDERMLIDTVKHAASPRAHCGTSRSVKPPDASPFPTRTSRSAPSLAAGSASSASATAALTASTRHPWTISPQRPCACSAFPTPRRKGSPHSTSPT